MWGRLSNIWFVYPLSINQQHRVPLNKSISSGTFVVGRVPQGLVCGPKLLVFNIELTTECVCSKISSRSWWKSLENEYVCRTRKTTDLFGTTLNLGRKKSAQFRFVEEPISQWWQEWITIVETAKLDNKTTLKNVEWEESGCRNEIWNYIANKTKAANSMVETIQKEFEDIATDIVGIFFKS